MNQDEWKGERLGKFTASEIGKLMKSGRGKEAYWGEGAITYIESRAAEIFNQQQITDIEGLKAIECGNAYEHEAAALFAERMNGDFIYYGKANGRFFPYEPVKQWAGGSPDGIVPHKSVAEIKCPEVSTHHIKYWRMREGKDLKDVKPIYYAQLQFNMMCTGLHHGYFVSYDPRPLSPEVRLKILEVPYDMAYCSELHERLNKAVDLLRTIIFNDILGNHAIDERRDNKIKRELIDDANALKI